MNKPKYGPSILLAVVIVLILLGIRGIVAAGNYVDEHSENYTGLVVTSKWNLTSVILPKEGYRVNYHCLYGDKKMDINNVTRILPQSGTVFNADGVFQISKDTCVRQVVKVK